MRYLRLFLIVLTLSTTLLAAESPFSGTWKLNSSKSKLPPPALQSDSATVDADDNGFKLVEQVVPKEGDPMNISYDVKYDGKFYPVTGDPSSDSISFERVNERTLKGTAKKGEKVTGKSVVTVSKDGKVTTVDFTDYTQPKPFKGKGVYDKQ